ncbi:MAG TPA: S41 family peptidase [Paludibacter sp.]
MKLFYLLAFFVVLTYSSLLAQTTINPPRIIRSVPEFGDCNVDPGLTAIEIEFDQDMQTGYSFIDDPDMVTTTSKPVWKTKRILTLPITLGPNKFYRVPMNNNTYNNFRNEAGTPMDATYLAFRTKTTIHPTLVDTILNRTNYEKFCAHFLTNYSYKDMHGINWKKLLDSIKPTIIKSEFENEFAVRLLQVLKKANDPHLSISINGKYFTCADIRITPLVYNYDAIFNELTDVQGSSSYAVLSGKVGEAGYMLIQTLNSQYKDDINYGVGVLREMKDLPYLILDLRLNTGGDETLAKTFVSSLISNSVTYEKVMTINSTTGVCDMETLKTLNPSSTSIRYKGKIFVLTSNRVVSSAESMVLMLKQMPNVEIVGTKTYGSSGNPVTFKATNAVSVNIPSWMAYTTNGQLIEGNGIEPDVKLEFPEEKFIAEDPIFEYVKNRMLTGIESPYASSDVDFTIFPNPVKETAHLRVSNTGNKKAAVQVLDMNGKTLIAQPAVSWSTVDNSLEINLKPWQLKPGIYFIKLTAEGKTNIQKMVYQP